MRDLAGGEQVEVIVTIDEEEYDKTRNELATVETQGTFKKLSWSIQVTNYLESGQGIFHLLLRSKVVR